MYSGSFASYNATGLCANVTDISVNECKALINLYNNTDGDNWNNNTNW